MDGKISFVSFKKRISICIHECFCLLNCSFFLYSSNIESSKTETFHLDIWDHDDDFSVFEAARKLNQVQGLKGLNRYFKQIAQSARINSNDNSSIDDFLGSVNIKINVYVKF